MLFITSDIALTKAINI